MHESSERKKKRREREGRKNRFESLQKKTHCEARRNGKTRDSLCWVSRWLIVKKRKNHKVSLRLTPSCHPQFDQHGQRERANHQQQWCEVRKKVDEKLLGFFPSFFFSSFYSNFPPPSHRSDGEQCECKQIFFQFFSIGVGSRAEQHYLHIHLSISNFRLKH